MARIFYVFILFIACYFIFKWTIEFSLAKKKKHFQVHRLSLHVILFFHMERLLFLQINNQESALLFLSERELKTTECIEFVLINFWQDSLMFVFSFSSALLASDKSDWLIQLNVSMNFTWEPIFAYCTLVSLSLQY